MEDRLTAFLTGILDGAWLLELFLMALSWVTVCHGPRWKKSGALRCFGELLILYACLLLTNAGLLVLLPKFIRILWAGVHGLAALIYMRYCSPFRRRTNLVLWCSMYAGVCAITVIAGMLSLLTGQFIMRGPLEGVVRCCVNCLLLPYAVHLNHTNFDEFDTIPSSGMQLIIVGDISLLALYVVESFWAGTDYRVTVTLAGAYTCILTMVIFAVNAMYVMCKGQAELISLQFEKQRMSAEKESMKLMETSLENLRCIRHDLKNQYAYLRILLEQKRYEDLEGYFQAISSNLPKQLQYIDCGNRVMNTILNMEAGKAGNAGVPVTHQLVVPPVLPFPENDLCAIIINLMDNAIEECRRLRDTARETPGIHLEIYPRNSYLCIVCRNATDRTALERQGWGLRTTKDDPRFHGFGTKIVSKTAEKYNGCAEFSIEGNCFVAKVMLDMMEGTEHADQDRTVR